MADPDGTTTDSLMEDLTAQPWTYDFFQAVRLLENRFRALPRVGWSLRPADDPVRLGQRPSMAFPSSTLATFGAGPPPRLFTQHFGLFGPNGALPLAWTEHAFMREKHHGDPTFTSFVNVFHHRMYSLFYRAWAASQKTVDLDRAGGAPASPEARPQRGDEEHFAVYVGSLFGIGIESLCHADTVPDHAKLYYSGRLVTAQRNPEGLEAILADFFRLPVKIHPFMGVWLRLPPGCECKLGDSPDTGRIGINAIVGSHVWDCQLNFRVRMGPTTLADFERMLPGSLSFTRLRDWVRNYCGEHYFWDLQLLLAKEEVPSAQLGRAGRLGWTTWLKTQPFDHDAEDLILRPSSV